MVVDFPLIVPYHINYVKGEFTMVFEQLKRLIQINNALIEAEARRKHFDARLTELFTRRRRNEAKRSEYIARLAADMYETDREIERLKARLEAVRG